MEKIKTFLAFSDRAGYGYGYGSDYGDGYGDGSGYGSGSGSGLISLNNKYIHYVDGIPTIIDWVKDGFAMGHIVKSDMTTIKTYITKRNNLFAHGCTLKEALKNLEIKIFSLLNTEEKILEFIKLFDKQLTYEGSLFYEWHTKLTGSCDQGKDYFIENQRIDLKKSYSVAEFIKLTETGYGSEIINKLKNHYEKENKI